MRFSDIDFHVLVRKNSKLRSHRFILKGSLFSVPARTEIDWLDELTQPNHWLPLVVGSVKSMRAIHDPSGHFRRLRKRSETLSTKIWKNAVRTGLEELVEDLGRGQKRVYCEGLEKLPPPLTSRGRGGRLGSLIPARKSSPNRETLAERPTSRVQFEVWTRHLSRGGNDGSQAQRGSGFFGMDVQYLECPGGEAGSSSSQLRFRNVLRSALSEEPVPSLPNTNQSARYWIGTSKGSLFCWLDNSDSRRANTASHRRDLARAIVKQSCKASARRHFSRAASSIIIKLGSTDTNLLPTSWSLFARASVHPFLRQRT